MFILNLNFSGSKYQEFQVPAMADSVKLQQFTSTPVDGDAATEQLDGVMVPDAFPDAPSVPVSSRVQGVVREPADGDDRGKPRI